RTIAISDALNLKTIRSEALEATLEALVCGVYLADARGRVVYMNPAAERQAAASTALRVKQERLTANDAGAQAALNKAIAKAAAGETETPACDITLGLPKEDGGGLVATILPLTRG